MSYILDALRKSEQERQRGKVPDFHGAPASVADDTVRRPNLWAIVAIGVVLINLLLAAMFWNKLIPDNRAGNLKPAVSDALPTEAGTSAESIADSKPHNPAPAVKAPEQANPLEDDIEKRDERSPITGTDDAGAEPSEPEYERINPHQSVNEDEYGVTQDAARSAPQMDYVPQIEELSSFERKNIPDMTFSSHMYSSIPKYRSVIINGKRLKEGQRYNGDIVVREITESGVVMSQGSVLFQVDVLGRWAQ